MKLVKGLLLGSAAALVSVVSAQAADLPTRKAAPVEYVRICDAYGAGFFYIPGTETCLKVGGLVLTEVRSYDASYSISPLGGAAGISGFGSITPLAGNFRTNGGASFNGYVPKTSQYSNARSRDSYGWNSLGRVELDARTASPWGTVRSFLRVDAYVGSGYANTGALSTGSSYATNFYNGSAGNGATRETTIVSKAFIQFAGLTAGRAQSMFDFYANAYNFQKIAGSAATTQLLAYTATFGGGFSATLSVEDQFARAAQIGSVAVQTGYTKAGVAYNAYVGNIWDATGYNATPAGARVPDVVGNLRLDQPWGAAQLSVAGHQANASLFGATAYTNNTTYAFPAASANTYGWAIQGGIQLNADYLSPGDKLWLQAAYEHGAIGYIWGDNLASSYGAVNGNRYYGSGYTPADTSAGWNTNMYDCVFTQNGSCEQQSGWEVTAAYKHYWIPSLASAVFGSYAQVNYSANALSGFSYGFTPTGVAYTTSGVGVSNLKTARIGTNLVWTPIKGFDLGAEFMYVGVTQSRPSGLAPNWALNYNGLPSWRGTNNEYEGRVRVQRAF